MSSDLSTFVKGKSAASEIIPEIRNRIIAIQSEGKTAWIGVGISNAFIGFSEKGASAPRLLNTKNIPYPGIRVSEKVSTPFINGVWARFNEEFHIRPSTYTFREIVH